jgi:hypothetical protein
MRIDREVLLNIAKQAAIESAADEPWVLAIYLAGSVARGEPIMGGTADIDLVIVHDEEMEGREIRRITENVHLDIHHHPRSFYKDGRKLRINSVWGHTLYYCLPLFDPKHFLSIIQASVRGMYKDPENTIQRVEFHLSEARDTWLDFHNSAQIYNLDATWRYLEAVQNTANAVSCLSGGPLPTRGFMLQYKKTVTEINHPGLYQGLLGLLGAFGIKENIPAEWFVDWQEVFSDVGGTEDMEELGKERQPYYFKAVEALSESEDPSYALWPVLYTWTMAIRNTDNEGFLKKWEASFLDLGLVGDGLKDRFEGLDLYLDQVETLVENWKAQHGI